MAEKFIHIGIWSFEYSRIADPYSKPRDPDPYPDFLESGNVMYKNVSGSAVLDVGLHVSETINNKYVASTMLITIRTLGLRFHGFTNEQIKAAPSAQAAT